MSISVDNLQPLTLIDITRQLKQNQFMSDMDKDQDGFITTDEVISSVRFFDAKDINEDGIVTMRETLEYLRQNPSKYIIEVPEASEQKPPTETEEELSRVLAFLTEAQNEETTSEVIEILIEDKNQLRDLIQTLNQDNDLSVQA